MPRVNELLREVIAEEVSTLKDPAIGFVTITAVETSPDLHNAFVYYTALGSPEEQAASAAALGRATPHLRSRLGSQVRLKYTPALEFRVDHSLATGMRIDGLLRDLLTDHDEGVDDA
jgi:ribosome-binding factor A